MSSELSKLVAIEKVASVDFLDAIFDCYQSGRVAVPIGKGGLPPAGYSFAETIAVRSGGGWFRRQTAPIQDDSLAQISFSSGTTGAPKAILLSHRALADVTSRLIGVSGVDGSLSEYCAVPPTFSFGLGRARVAAAVGGQLYLPERGFDPGEFARMLAAGEVNALAAVPTLLRVLISNPGLIAPDVGARLRWMEIGSQPMSAAEKRAVRDMFPNARITQHYGLSEASRTTFLDIGQASEEELHSVGRVIGRTEMRIDGEGHICIRGPHVADGILGPDGPIPIVDGEGWLRTNDLGRIDEQGFLYFLGRADDLINVGGVKVPAETFEERLVARLGAHAAGIAVAALEDQMRGQVVGVARMAAVPAADLADAVAAVGPEFGLRAADVRVVEIQDIPRTETNKVRRRELSETLLKNVSARPAQTAAAAAVPAVSAMSPAEQEIARIWCDALGLTEIDRNDTFFDLGGDSLSAINVMLSMERAGVPQEITRQIFEGRSVAEIARSASDRESSAEQPVVAPSGRLGVSDAISMTRALLVAVVVGGHWFPFLLERAGDLSAPLTAITNPLFRFGTPGFAIVYGLGLTFYSLSVFRRHPDRLRSTTRTNLMVVAGGVALLGLFRFFDRYLEGAPINPSALFFGVLLGYVLLIATSVQLLRFLAGRQHPILSALLLSATSLLLAEVARRSLDHLQTDGFLELARLMVVAKYAYPQMLGYAAIGMAMGLWIDGQRDSPHLARQALLVGLALVEASLLMTLSLGLGDYWLGATSAFHMLVGYAGLVLLVFGLFLFGSRQGWFGGILRVPARVMILTGTLAFVAFVGHELTLPFHHVLVFSGVPTALSLLISVGLFIGGFGYALRRLYRLYYGN